MTPHFNIRSASSNSRPMVNGAMTSPFEELKESRGHLFALFSRGEVRESFQEEYTEAMDIYFRRILQESVVGRRLFREKHPFSFVALGGYGRRELCYYSDIDIMILFSGRIPSYADGLVEEIFYPLWDLGLDLGYAIRNIRDCTSLSRKDFRVFTSLMDARLIGGDSLLYLSLMEDLRKKVFLKNAVPFLRWLEEQNRVRMASFGDASYLLEPSLKEGIGGLREYHIILWLTRAFFNLRQPRDLEYLGMLSHQEYEVLGKDLRFIWLVRNHLHELSRRKNDRLTFDYQTEIARRLGFQDKLNFLAVEQFLGKLHAVMASIKSLRRSFVISHFPLKHNQRAGARSSPVSGDLHLEKGEITFNDPTSILSNTVLLMDIFERSAFLGCPLSLEAKRLVREFLHLVDDGLRASEEPARKFLNIMGHPNAFETLEQMFETGFLEAFIPEFRDIRDRIQFDAYHIFPVGRHALQTLRHLKDISRQQDLLLVDILSELSNPEPLFLAALFHDIGKTGKQHALRGAAITWKILKRLGFRRKRAEEIIFLVRHHLLLAETATRRDLNDEKAVIQCARTTGDIERLKMLYLLTWADSMATGPGAWSEWTANLVRELFFKVLHALERKELATPDAGRRVRKTLKEVRRQIAGRIRNPDLNRLLDAMPPRYLLEMTPSEIVRHLEVLMDLEGIFKDPGSTRFYLEAKEEESRGCWELTLLAGDRPGLFSHIAGVLALNNINILSAHIYTWRDGTAADSFKVTSPLDPIYADETWERVKRDLRNTFAGRLPLTERLEKKGRPSILSRQKKSVRPPKVTIDNESSDFFTLIEVFADDRVGLLYEITHVLFSLQLDIQIAKISTKADQIADVFYVRDLEGQKVEDNSRVREIEKALLHLLEQG
jgi:[protein-PII] uridylyltransferase